jgi:hypothetical protein
LRKDVTLNIYSTSGQLLYSESIPSVSVLQKDFSVSALGLSSGVYMLQVITSNGIETKTFCGRIDFKFYIKNPASKVAGFFLFNCYLFNRFGFFASLKLV